MSDQMQAPAATVPTVYAAIELSKKNWVLAIARLDRDQPSIHRIAGGCIGDLIRKLRAGTREGDRLMFAMRPDMTASGWRAHLKRRASRAGFLTQRACRSAAELGG